MTDHPRFEPMHYGSDDAHRHHHGGRIVDFVLGVVDRRALRRPSGRALRTLKFEVGIPITLVLLLSSLALASFGTGHALKFHERAGAELAPGTEAGRDPSPDEDAAGGTRRRPQGSYPYAAYAP
jgi:hypothetical protein